MPSAARCLIIACGALVPEIRQILEKNRLGPIEVRAVPALHHNRPEKIAPAVASHIAEARHIYDRIFVAYADCGTGGALDRVIAEAGAERLPGPHCYAFYSGVDAFAKNEDPPGTFYLTDFLARQFEALVIRGLGIDRHPELLAEYFGNYERVVYLSQAATPVSLQQAREAAVRLGLAFEHRPVGYGELEGSLVAQFAGADATAADT